MKSQEFKENNKKNNIGGTAIHPTTKVTGFLAINNKL